MKSKFLRGAMAALLTIIVGLGYAPSAAAGSHIFKLAYVPSTVLYSASTCQQQPPPDNGVPQWPVVYYAAHRKSTRARGLLAVHYLQSNGQWFEAFRFEHRTWTNGVAIYGFPAYGQLIRMYVIVAVPKVGDVYYPITNESYTIPFSCG
ncbi:MAG: hypothetical protein HOP03_05315 [Lysobacter sp.]|nr:hypothetical protein [Lysobacter sp.]